MRQPKLKRLCGFPGCENRHDSKGLCTSHMKQFKKDPNNLRPLNHRTRYDWLVERLGQPFGVECEEWPFGESRVYARIRHDGQSWQVHQLSLLLLDRAKPIGENIEALHSCDNKRCFNPNHLRWGTRQENMQEAWDRGRRKAA